MKSPMSSRVLRALYMLQFRIFTKPAMGLGEGLQSDALAKQTDPGRSASCALTRVAARIHAASIGVGDIGFYGNARKPDALRRRQARGAVLPTPLLGGTYEQFGVAVQSLPAKLVPVAVERVLAHFCWNREEGEKASARYVLRHKVETFQPATRRI